MNTLIRMLSTLLLTLLLVSCSDKEEINAPDSATPTKPGGSPSLPNISSLSPVTAEIGDVLTITGTNFGPKQGSGYWVTFNGIIATVYTSWSRTQITVVVPSGSPSGTVQVKVNTGTAQSSGVNMTLLPSSPVIIGSQIWMGANLSVTEYRDGTPIPEVTDQSIWVTLTTGAWCYYNNDPSTEPLYGRLYNWYAVNSPLGLAPAGWHIASDDEYKTLSMYLGMPQAVADMSGGYFGTTEGGKMKEMGTSLWRGNNYGATNSSGFTALPGGIRKVGGVFDFIGSYAGWWTSTEDASGSAAWYRGLSSSAPTILRSAIGKDRGMSVRCVKDN